MPEQRLLQAFDQQAAWCQQPSPFGARLLARSRAWLASQPQPLKVLSALADDPLAAAVALRWLAALHHLALLGREPWASLWPPARSSWTDEELDHAINTAWSDQQPHLQAALAGPPQTNEVQRSAALLPGLLHIAQRTGQALAVAEIGASAGLNLWCDRYRHEHAGPPQERIPECAARRYSDEHAGPPQERIPECAARSYSSEHGQAAWAWGNPAAGLTLRSEWTGAAPPQVPLHILRRAGCDVAPVDLTWPGEGLRLTSFVWPDQPERLSRLRAAMRVAQAHMAQTGVGISAQRAADFVRAELARRPAQGAWVLMHSVVWQYIPADEQASITQQVELAGQAATWNAPVAWLRMEPLKADLRVELRCRLWPGGHDELLAVCHPHGAWVQWQLAA